MKYFNRIPCIANTHFIAHVYFLLFLFFTGLNVYAQPNSTTKYELGWEPGGNPGNKKNRVWKKALIDASKNPIFPWGTYDKIEPYSGNIFIVSRGKGRYEGTSKFYGLYDADLRKEIQPCTATLITPPDSCCGYIEDEKGMKSYLDLKGNDAASERFRNISTMGKSYNIVYKIVPPGIALGLLDKCGRELTQLYYNTMSKEKDGFITVGREGKFTFIDIRGKEQLPPTFMYLTEFSNSVAAFSETGSFVNGVYRGTSWGFINTKGEILTKERFEDVANFDKFLIVNGSVNVKKGNDWISYTPLATPDVAVSLKPKIIPFQDEKKKLWGYRIDGSGEVIVKPQYTNARPYENGHAFVEKLVKFSKESQFYLWGVIDETGKIIIPLEYNEISIFTENYYKVGQKSREMEYGLMDLTGSKIIPPDFVFMGEFKEEMIAVCNYEGKAGFMNIKGDYVIEPNFKKTRDFSEGLAPVSKDGKTWYWIDYQGKPFMEASGFVAVTIFKNGTADVWTTKDKWGRFDGKMTIDSDSKILTKYAMNAPPTTVEYEVECNMCRGSGDAYLPVVKTTTTTDVDNYNVFAPGGKVITTTTRKKTEYVKSGKCMYCNGKGRVIQSKLKF